MIGLFAGSLGVRAYPILRQRVCAFQVAAPCVSRPVSSAATSSANTHAGLIVRDGRALLYRGPSPTRTGVTFAIGAMFIGVGANLAYSFINNMVWPLTMDDPENPPQLVGLGKRVFFADRAMTLTFTKAWIFIATPTKTVTKLTLDVTGRHLIIRTATRGFSALFPRAIYPRPFRTIAELKGFYKTDLPNERIVPLQSVYRIRGSALEAGKQDKFIKHLNAKRNTHLLDVRQCLEFTVGNERAWYRLETAGGAKPPKGAGYKGFWRRIQHALRGKTDWEGDEGIRGQLGNKEPWFADRKTFDDVIPLVKRK